MAFRVKTMVKKEFTRVADRQWIPVVLSGEGLPKWMQGIPEDITELVLASGTFIDPRIVQLNSITYDDVVGGIDVFRYDEKDKAKGFPYNKDHYILVINQSNEDAILVHGPLKDHRHWIEQLPELPDGIEVIESKAE